MGKFLIRLFIFLIPLLAVVVFIEYRLYKLPNSYSRKKAFFEPRLDSVEVLVLGSSHALKDINPVYLSKPAFNLGNISQSLYYDRELTLKYLERMPKLHLVIIPISYFSLYNQLSFTPEYWRGYFYTRYWGIDCNDLPLLDIKRWSLIALYTLPVTKDIIKDGFNNDFMDASKDMLPNGFLGHPLPGSENEINDSTAKLRVELFEHSMRSSGEGRNIQILAELIGKLKQRGVQVSFITTPVCATMNKYLKKETVERNVAVVDSLCRQYGCKYYNYLHDERFEKGDFMDNDHLDATGAKKFSEILDSDIIGPAHF